MKSVLLVTYAVQVMVDQVANNLEMESTVMADRNAVEMISVQVSYMNMDDCHLDFHYNHIE